MFLKDFSYGGKNLYETSEGYEKLLILYFTMHLLLEVVYVYAGCMPMIYANIGSVIFYFALFFVNKTDHKKLVAWCIMWEIFLHAIVATVFMGYGCGFFFWIIALFSMIFVPFYIPTDTPFLKGCALVYEITNVLAFVLLKLFSDYYLLPSKYVASTGCATLLYILNAFIAISIVVGHIIISSHSMDSYNAQLKKMNETDYLTGLYNRKYMIGLFNKELDRMDAGESGDISIAILDIDFFKKINDTYGHNAGDEILIDLANIFRFEGEGKYTVARWGGEEFAILGSYELSYDAFCEELKNLNKKIASTGFIADNNELTVTVSIGAAHYEPGMTIVDIVKRADDRLYEAKETGRNKVITSSENLLD
ncbi:GGDEF domain-containing protein [Butyrivibrio sp. INlla21]|uniref:GGDEF domain-containing protein n=1 Tax=Butyrivibrio sp. INlla21 TaxID=1520811 RepID=UPI0008E96B25|nr:GGDEF domain-containing protein [Butyrivibrio sp. INlla21]SFV03724.1 diguanylate cyclase (GGDEF) domain-containing protein [Butyrivibrio sp. INlla21]